MKPKMTYVSMPGPFVRLHGQPIKPWIGWKCDGAGICAYGSSMLLAYWKWLQKLPDQQRVAAIENVSIEKRGQLAHVAIEHQRLINSIRVTEYRPYANQFGRLIDVVPTPQLTRWQRFKRAVDDFVEKLLWY